MKIRGLFLTSLGLSMCAGGTGAAGQEIDGTWKGAISVVDQEIEIIVHLSSAETELTGTIDIAVQSAVGLELINLSHEHPSIRFEIAGAPGQPTFDGQHMGDSISGEFTQSGIAGTFVLAKTDEADAILDNQYSNSNTHSAASARIGGIRAHKHLKPKNTDSLMRARLQIGDSAHPLTAETAEGAEMGNMGWYLRGLGVLCGAHGGPPAQRRTTCVLKLEC